VAYLRAFKMLKWFYRSIFNSRMKWSVFTIFGRVMNSKEEFCSDWLFHFTHSEIQACKIIIRQFSKIKTFQQMD